MRITKLWRSGICGLLVLLGGVAAHALPDESYITQGGLQLWLKADSLSSLTTAVDQWSDSSGNANHVTQTGANRPTYIGTTYVGGVAVLKGAPVVNFSATSTVKQYLTAVETPGLNPAKEITLISVVRRTTGSGISTAAMMVVEKGYTSADVNNGYSLRFSGIAQAAGFINSNGTAYAAPSDAFCVLASTYDGVENRLYVNGVLVDVNAYTPAIAVRGVPLSVGGRLYAGTLAPVNNLNGDIAELLMYGRALSDAERKDIEAYLYAKYGVGAEPTAADPVFSVKTGTYAGTQTVRLSCPEMPGAVLCYTLDGSNPVESTDSAAVSKPYSAPFTVVPDPELPPTTPTKITIKARAFKPGYKQPTEASTAVITIDASSSLLARSGLLVWLKADTLSAGEVSEWLDQSGNTFNAKQTLLPNKPQLSSTSTGKLAVQFDTGDYLSIADAPLLNNPQVSVFAVVERTSGSAAGVIAEKYSSAPAGYSVNFSNLTTARVTANGTSASIVATTATPQTVLVEVISDQSFLSINVNGGATPTSVAAGALGAATSPLYIGGKATAYTFLGKVAEVIIYNRGINIQERRDLAAYFFAKYNLGVKPTLEKPEFSLQGGVYPPDQSLRLFASPGAIIWYKKNGGDATKYKTPLEFTTGVNSIEAWAARDGYNNSLPANETFTVEATSSDYVVRDGLELWLKADTLPISTTNVSLWSDLSGKGNHARQNNMARQPVYNANGVSSGKPAVDFTASELDHLIVTNVPGLNPAAVTVLAVVKRNEQTAIRDTVLVKGSDTSGYGLLYADTSPGIISTINANNVAATATMGVYNLVAMSYDGATQTLVYNGEVVTDKYSTPVALGTSDLTIGGSGASKALQGSIAEILVYSRALSVDEIVGMQAHFYQNYALGVKPLAAAPVANIEDVKIVTDDSPKLVIKSASNATIYYTTDSNAVSPSESTPNPSGWLVYASPIPLSGAETYRFYATRPNCRLSPVSSIRAIADPTARSVSDAKPMIWYRADSLNPVDLSPVDVWKNSSKEGSVNLMQSTLTRQPQFLANAVNGKPAVKFDGSSDFLRTSTGGYLNYQTGTILVVAKPVDNSGNRYIFRDVDEGRIYAYSQRNHTGERWTGPALYSANGKAVMTLLYPSGPTDPTYLARYKVATHSAPRTPGSYAIIGGSWQALKTATAYVNYTKGTAALSQVDLADSGFNVFTVGSATANDGSLGGFFGGELAEFMIFNRILNADEHARINAYLNLRYGINESLPPIMKPRFYPGGGTYANADEFKKVTIQSEAGTKIYNDINQDPFVGGQPRAGLSPYGNPIEVLAGQRLHARATYISPENIVPPGGASEEMTATYTVEPAIATVSRRGLKLWLKADSLLPLAHGAAITRWEDQSGSANHATLTTEVTAPTFILSSSLLNDKPAVSFGAGSAQYLTIKDHASLRPKQVSVVVIARRATGTTGSWLVCKSNGTTGYGLSMDNTATIRSQINNTDALGALSTSPVLQTGKFNVLMGLFDQSTNRVLVNGAQPSASVVHTGEIVDYTPDLSIGASSVGASPFNGEIAEVLVYDHALGDDERKGLLDYAYAKYRVGPIATLRAPVTSLPDGRYSSEQSLVLTSPDNEGLLTTSPDYKTIYYTTDGSNPTSASTPYTTPVSLDHTQTVKAIVAAINYADSPVVTLRFIYTPPPPGPSGLPTDNGAPTTYQTDSDGDGVPDAIEVAIGSDPNNPASTGNGVGRTYQYDALHQLISDGVKTYNYDAEGNASRN